MDFFIFENDRGIVPLTYKQTQIRKGEFAINVGLKEIQLDDFRHTIVFFLVNSGALVTIVFQ